jgi:hypothetical protein
MCHSLKEGIAESNPVMNTNNQAEEPRDRVLSDGELAIIWEALAGPLLWQHHQAADAHRAARKKLPDCVGPRSISIEI